MQLDSKELVQFGFAIVFVLWPHVQNGKILDFWPQTR